MTKITPIISFLEGLNLDGSPKVQTREEYIDASIITKVERYPNHPEWTVIYIGQNLEQGIVVTDPIEYILRERRGTSTTSIITAILSTNQEYANQMKRVADALERSAEIAAERLRLEREREERYYGFPFPFPPYTCESKG